MDNTNYLKQTHAVDVKKIEEDSTYEWSGSEIAGTISDLFNLILLKVRLSHLYKLYLHSSKVRSLVSKEGYWRERLRREGFKEPNFEVFSWRHWYLEVTEYPIPGEVYVKGYNQDHRLGINDPSTYIKLPIRVAPLSTKHANSTGYGIINCEIDGIKKKGGLGVFIDSFGYAYICGRDRSDKECSNYVRVPPQLLSKVGRVDQAHIAGEVIFFLQNRSIKCFHHNTVNSEEPKYVHEYHSILPSELEGRVISFVITHVWDDDTNKLTGHNLIVLDDQGMVYYSKIEQPKFEFRRPTFTTHKCFDNTYVSSRTVNVVVVKLETGRVEWGGRFKYAKVTSIDNVVYEDEGEDEDFVSDEGCVKNKSEFRKHNDYFILKKDTSHPIVEPPDSPQDKHTFNLYATFDRIVPFGPNT